MVNKARPLIPVTLDKPRHLLFDLNAMVAFEEETGINLFNPGEKMKLAGGMTPKQLRAFLWACLLHEDETLTLKQVGSWLHAGNTEEIARTINDAVAAAMPEGGEEAGPLAISPQPG